MSRQTKGIVNMVEKELQTTYFTVSESPMIVRDRLGRVMATNR